MPRRFFTAPVCSRATLVESPIEASLTYSNSLARATSIRYGTPSSISAAACSTSKGMPSVRASSLKVPSGRASSGRPVARKPASAETTVPSPPPTATTSASAARAMMAWDSSPGAPLVWSSITVWPRARNAAAARSRASRPRRALVFTASRTRLGIPVSYPGRAGGEPCAPRFGRFRRYAGHNCPTPRGTGRPGKARPGEPKTYRSCPRRRTAGLRRARFDTALRKATEYAMDWVHPAGISS